MLSKFWRGCKSDNSAVPQQISGSLLRIMNNASRGTRQGWSSDEAEADSLTAEMRKGRLLDFDLRIQHDDDWL